MNSDINIARIQLIDRCMDVDFTKKLEEYKQSNSEYIQTITTFLNSIKTNKDYYKMNISYRNSRYNTNKSSDTFILKKIHNYMNICSSSNIDNILEQIQSMIPNKQHLYPRIIECILEKCIIQPMYIELYIRMLHIIVDEEYTHITINKIFRTLFKDKSTEESSSLYLQLCNKNKKSDNMVGFSICLTHLEKHKLVTNQLEILIKYLLSNIDKKITTENDDIYTDILCLYNISLIQNIYFVSHKEKIQEYIKIVKSKKCKFKLQDIYDNI